MGAQTARHRLQAGETMYIVWEILAIIAIDILLLLMISEAVGPIRFTPPRPTQARRRRSAIPRDRVGRL